MKMKFTTEEEQFSFRFYLFILFIYLLLFFFLGGGSLFHLSMLVAPMKLAFVNVS